MGLTRFVSTVFLAAVITFGGGREGAAQELNAKWLAGTWRATVASPAGGGLEDRLEIVVREDGTFKGDIQSARGGLVYYRQGSLSIAHDTVTLETVIEGGPPFIHGSKVVLALKRKGDNLEGTEVRYWNNSTVQVTFKRAK